MQKQTIASSFCDDVPIFIWWKLQWCQWSVTLLGRLYTFQISHFAGISQMFLRNTPQNTKRSLYTFRISCEFHILLMPQKNKPQNPLTFCANADPSTKCEKRKKRPKMRKKWCEIRRSTLFIFRILWSCSRILR